MVHELRRSGRDPGPILSFALRRTARQSLIAFIVVVAAGCSAGVPTGTGSPAPSDGEFGDVQEISAYPLDRTLAGLAGDSRVDAVLLVDDVQLEPPHLSTGNVVITPVSGSVARVFRGAFTGGQRTSIDVVGGRIGKIQTFVDETYGVDPSVLDPTGTYLIAGAVTNGKVEPWYVYRIATDGTASSLLISGSPDVKPMFTLTDLETAIEK